MRATKTRKQVPQKRESTKKNATKPRKHEKQDRYASRTGAVLFVRKLDQVAAFYRSVLGLREVNRDGDHILLESPGFQLVVHRIINDAATVELSDPPDRRASAALKPVFFVERLANVRAIAKRHGGAMEPSSKEWSFDGVMACDAVDPEGNVIQFREAQA